MVRAHIGDDVRPAEVPCREPIKLALAARRTRSGLATAALLWACLATSPAWGQANPYALQPNPANYDSTLVAGDGSQVPGTSFASWAQTALIKNGVTTVYDATFLLQQCYGGGILNDLQASLDSKVSWVGSSASTVTQPSYGSGANPTGIEPWTSALTAQLAMPTQTVLTSVTNAANNDIYGANHANLETGQIVYNGAPNQGVTFNYNLNEPKNGATNEVAVLWAGAPNPRHLADINAMYNTLTTLWRGQSYQIFVLYDSTGATPPAGAAWTNGSTVVNGHTEAVSTTSATSAALQTLMTSTLAPGGTSAMTTSTQFLFYSSDHGGFDNRVNAASPFTVPSSSSDKEPYTLTAADLASIRESGATPSLTFTYYGLTQAVPVYWNGYFLGDLAAGGTMAAPLTMTFNDFAFVLAQNNTIEIDNDNNTTAFVVLSKEFYSGADDGIIAAAVPEPSSLVLGTLGILGMVGLIRSRRGTRSRPRPGPGGPPMCG